MTWIMTQVHKHRLENATIALVQLDAEITAMSGRLAQLEAARTRVNAVIADAHAQLNAGGGQCR